MNFKEKLAKFFAGRYGGDSLNTVLNAFSVAALIAAVIVFGASGTAAAKVISLILWLVSLGLLGLGLFRTFSRNLTARRAEYEWYRSHIAAPIAKRRREARTRREHSATHRFFKCPGCGQTVRVPKGKGKIRITCPKCGKVFEKKS